MGRDLPDNLPDLYRAYRTIERAMEENGVTWFEQHIRRQAGLKQATHERWNEMEGDRRALASKIHRLEKRRPEGSGPGFFDSRRPKDYDRWPRICSRRGA